MCDTELFYSVGIYYSEFKVKKNSGSSAAVAERKSGENRTCCGNQLGMILTYAHYSQLLRGVRIIFIKIIFTLNIWIRYNLRSILRSFTLCCIYLRSLACLWSKMPMFQWAGMREGGEPLPLAFQYLILMIWRPCDLNLVMRSLVALKWQDFKVGMPIFQPFYVMKL